MGMIRESFVIFKDWDDAIRKAPEDVQLELYHALMDYAKTGEKPENLSWHANMFLSAISTGLESTINRYRASVENGKMGGRPKKETKPKEEIENLEKPSKTYDNLSEPTQNLNVNVNVNENDNVDIKKKNIKEKSTLESGNIVQKDYLTDEQVINYVKEQIHDQEVCSRFLDFVANRKAMGKKHAMRTKKTVDLNISFLRKHAKNTDEALAILDYSIMNNYQGLFELKDKNSNKAAEPRNTQYVSPEEAKAWES